MYLLLVRNRLFARLGHKGKKISHVGTQLHRGISVTVRFVSLQLDVSLFWRYHFVTCVPARVILYLVTWPGHAEALFSVLVLVSFNLQNKLSCTSCLSVFCNYGRSNRLSDFTLNFTAFMFFFIKFSFFICHHYKLIAFAYFRFFFCFNKLLFNYI